MKDGGDYPPQHIPTIPFLANLYECAKEELLQFSKFGGHVGSGGDGGTGTSKAFKVFTSKFFYVMGKALTELPCTWTIILLCNFKKNHENVGLLYNSFIMQCLGCIERRSTIGE